jgi:predicted ATPase/DNA-binding CsgD family transcriptional regulator
MGTHVEKHASLDNHVGSVPRAALVAEVLALMRQPGLITLIGPPGVGKTHAARVVRDRLQTCVWVEAAPADSTEHVLGLLMNALKLPDHGDIESSLERAIAYLNARDAVVILDNLEHLNLAELLDRIVTACPALSVLCTSRTPTRCAAERLLSVPPLTIPDPNDDSISAMRAEAVQLYVQRATKLNPRFRLEPHNTLAVNELCRQSGGLPLALEMLAAASGLYSPEAQLERYRRDPNASLGGSEGALMRAVNASLQRLSPIERRLFARLGICAGGWDIAVAAALSEGTPTEASAILERLIEHQLVVIDEVHPRRFGFLEPIRAVARRELEAAGDESEAGRIHATHFLSVIQEAQAALQSPRAAESARLLSLDRWNFDVALQFWRSTWTERAELVLALRPLATGWGRLRDHRTIMNELIASSTPDRAQLPALLVWRALSGKIVGDANGVHHDLRTALTLVEKAASHSVGREAYALLGSLAINAGQFRSGRRILERVLAWRRTHDDATELARHLTSHGMDLYIALDIQSAEALLREARDRFGNQLSHENLISVDTTLAAIAMTRDDFGVAEILYAEARQRALELDDPLHLAIVDHATGCLFDQQDDPTRASVYWRDALRRFHHLGHFLGTVLCLDQLAALLVDTSPELMIRVWACVDHQRSLRDEPRHTGLEPLLQTRRAIATQRLGTQRVKQLEAEGAVERLSVIVQKLLEDAPWEKALPNQPTLSPRELEVLVLLAGGGTDKAIGRRLGITERTARFHANAIMQKLGVRTRSQAVDRAWTLGVLKGDSPT